MLGVCTCVDCTGGGCGGGLPVCHSGEGGGAGWQLQIIVRTHINRYNRLIIVRSQVFSECYRLHFLL